jgi:hypothetical protein
LQQDIARGGCKQGVSVHDSPAAHAHVWLSAVAAIQQCSILQREHISLAKTRTATNPITHTYMPTNTHTYSHITTPIPPSQLTRSLLPNPEAIGPSQCPPSAQGKGSFGAHGNRLGVIIPCRQLWCAPVWRSEGNANATVFHGSPSTSLDSMWGGGRRCLVVRSVRSKRD